MVELEIDVAAEEVEGSERSDEEVEKFVADDALLAGEPKRGLVGGEALRERSKTLSRVSLANGVLLKKPIVGEDNPVADCETPAL
jgi:hypothetical protein